MGLRDRVAAANASRPRAKVRVEAWGEDVWVRSLSAAEQVALEDYAAARRGQPGETLDVLVRLVALSVADEAGGRAFDDGDADAALLRAAPAAALAAVAREAQRLNALTPDAAKEIDESFAGRQRGSSPTG